MSFTGTSNFICNSAEHIGGAIDAYDNVVLIFYGANNFINNSANNDSGGAIDAYNNVVLTFHGANNFINNSANNDSGGAIYSEVKILLSFTGNISFSSNSALRGGAIFAHESTLRFDGNISFTENEHNTGDSHGGAIYLYISSSLTIMPNTTVYWENSHANLGGAIYVFDANSHI